MTLICSPCSIHSNSGNLNPIRWTWVTMIGPDAKDFLHRLTTVNVKMLTPGKGAPGFFLTPMGKVRAYFQLWNFGPNEYAFEFDSGRNSQWKTDLFAIIDQFTFSETFALNDFTSTEFTSNQENQLESRWLFSDSESSDITGIESKAGEKLAAGQTIAIDDEIRLCHHGESDFGRSWITAWGRPGRLSQWVERTWGSNLKEVDRKTLESWRIQKVRPWVDTEINENSNPLELGLDDAIAKNKGCYPGQEVIEKIISLGSPPRRLARIDGLGSFTDAAPNSASNPASNPALKMTSRIFNLATPAVEIGSLTSWVQSDNQFQALGLIKKIHAKEGLKVRFSETGTLETADTATSIEGSIVKISSYDDSDSQVT